MTEKNYSRIEYAEEMVKKICEKYPDAFWRVSPGSIIVLGIENLERKDKNKNLAKIKSIKGVEKALMQVFNIKVKYVIELFWSDWSKWSEIERQWVLISQLFKIHEEGVKIIQHDLSDFKIILQSLMKLNCGVDWFFSSNLPNVLDEDFEFDLELLPEIELPKEEEE